MAQQIFDQYAPLAKVSANETIPVVAAIAQTRDGKDELLLGNVPFVPGPGGLYVPVSASNRLPVEATLSGQLTEIRSAGVIAGGSTTPDSRNSANFRNSIGALATVVHFDVKEPVWLHQLAFIQHVHHGVNERNVVYRLYIYDSNGNAIWLPLMNSNDAFSNQYLRMSSFINNDFTVRITEAYPWRLLPPVAWESNAYTAGLVFTAVPLPCPHGFRFESYNPDQENAISYRFQGMAYYTRM